MKAEALEIDNGKWQEFTGRRRQIESRPALPLKWPSKTKERYDLFDAWHNAAAQILHLEGGSFRLLSVIERVIFWKDGTITASNEQLAARAGGCHSRTVQIDVSQYVKLGIVVLKMGWRKRRDGHIVRTRTIKLALPTRLSPSVSLPEMEFDDERSVRDRA
jgi:hypothetical protein